MKRFRKVRMDVISHGEGDGEELMERQTDG